MRRHVRNKKHMMNRMEEKDDLIGSREAEKVSKSDDV